MLGAVTEREIRSEPELWRTTADRLAGEAAQLGALIRDASHVLLVGCGSSYYAGVVMAEILRASGAAGLALTSSDYVQRPPVVDPRANPLLVAFSRSGRTSETCQAIDIFRERHPGATAVAISCDAEGGVAARAQHVVAIPEGQEEAVPQTRSVSGFWLTALLLGATRRGVDARPDVLSAADRVDAIENTLWERLETSLGGFDRTVLLGGGIGFALAHEANLKLMEMARTDSWAYLTLEFRHSPLEAIDDRTLLIAPLGDTTTPAEDEAVAEAAAFAGAQLDVPSLLELSAGPGAVLAQLYALHALALLGARAAGRDCDVLDRLERFVETAELSPGAPAS